MNTVSHSQATTPTILRRWNLLGAWNASETHPRTLLVPQLLQTHYRVLAKLVDLVMLVDVLLTFLYAIKKQRVVGLNIFHCLERVLSEPVADPRNDSLVQEEIRYVGRLAGALHSCKRTKTIANQGGVVSPYDLTV